MALSQDEMQSIINAVLSSIRTNSRTINQLTPVTSLDENDYFELSGGRRIRFDVLRQMILPEYEEDYNVVAAIKTLRSTIEKINSDNEIRDERLESLEKFKDRKGRPGGIAPLNHDGIIDEQYLPELLRNGGCFPLPEFEKVIQGGEIQVANRQDLNADMDGCEVVYDVTRMRFLLNVTSILSSGGTVGGNEPAIGETEPGGISNIGTPEQLEGGTVENPGGQGTIGGHEGEVSELLEGLVANWGESARWGEATADGVKPMKGKIYVERSTGILWYWTGYQLRAINGKATNIVDRGPWTAGETYYDGSEITASGIYEISLVWHNGHGWQCREGGIAQEGNKPGWNEPTWEHSVGDPNLKIEFEEVDSIVDVANPTYDLHVKATYLGDDVTNAVATRYDWTRKSYRNGTEDVASDTLWNTTHKNVGPHLVLTSNDMNFQFGSAPQKLTYTVTVTLSDSNNPELQPQTLSLYMIYTEPPTAE